MKVNILYSIYNYVIYIKKKNVNDHYYNDGI